MELGDACRTPTAIKSVRAPRIAIVEDYREIARALATIVDSLGGVPVIAHDCCAARPLLRESLEGLIVDVSLPDGSGFDLIDLFRAEHPSARVLVVTGLDGADIANKAHLLNVEYVRKPVVAASVREFVVRCIGVGPDRVTALIAEVRAQYQLTDAEARLVAASLRSSANHALAVRLGVKLSTVRTQAAAVRAKTRCGSIEEFAATLRSRLLVE